METEKRKLAVIMFTDMVGYSKKMQQDEDQAFRLLGEHNDILDLQIRSYNGKVIKTIGDAFMVEFDSVFNAVNCAVDIQKRLAARNEHIDPTEIIEVRIGIHVGDVMYKDKDVFGDGVNIASRIESIAGPRQIYISVDVYSISLGKLTYEFKDIGVQELKNISRPVHVYEVLWDERRMHEAAVKPVKSFKPSRRLITIGVAALAGLIVVVVVLVSVFRKGAEKPTLVIVPFSDQTGDRSLEQVQIGKTIADAATQKFSNWSKVSLISPILLSKKLKDRNVSEDSVAADANLAADITRSLDGRLLITGNIKKLGKIYILTANLNDLKDNTLLESFVVRQEAGRNILGTPVDNMAEKFKVKITQMLKPKTDSPKPAK
jgi:adenylate cyclase